MTGTVLILGANGRFGRAATQAFLQNGWDVRAASRTGEGDRIPRITRIACDVTNRPAVIAAAEGADVIVHAVNPPYHKWADQLPILSANIIAAGLSSGAAVMIPGNVYAFGKNAPTILREDAALTPTSRKGALRVTMERAFADAAESGLRTIILRGGDFIEREQTGNWFDSQIANKAHKGIFTYPGRMDAVHAWAYLPDMARAMADLAEIRTELPRFATFGFEGYSLTGAELKAAVALSVAHPLKLKSTPWGILGLIGVFSPVLREVIEMRYLWDTPHRIDGTALQAALPHFKLTPLAVAMSDALNRQATSSLSQPISRARSA
jgi:nucleoside-diphosphate-sugar epimerase